jgi:hypothetical protein
MRGRAARRHDVTTRTIGFATPVDGSGETCGSSLGAMGKTAHEAIDLSGSFE